MHGPRQRVQLSRATMMTVDQIQNPISSPAAINKPTVLASVSEPHPLLSAKLCDISSQTPYSTHQSCRIADVPSLTAGYSAAVSLQTTNHDKRAPLLAAENTRWLWISWETYTHIPVYPYTHFLHQQTVESHYNG